jgi:hypothetical protein
MRGRDLGAGRGGRFLLSAALCWALAVRLAAASDLPLASPLGPPGLAPLDAAVVHKPVLRLAVGADWDRAERALMWSYLGLSAIDMYQTSNRPSGFAETNPLVSSWAGAQPSDAELLLFKSAATYGIVRLADRIPSGRKRKAALALLTVVQLSMDLRNERITGGILLP